MYNTGTQACYDLGRLLPPSPPCRRAPPCCSVRGHPDVDPSAAASEARQYRPRSIRYRLRSVSPGWRIRGASHLMRHPPAAACAAGAITSSSCGCRPPLEPRSLRCIAAAAGPPLQRSARATTVDATAPSRWRSTIDQPRSNAWYAVIHFHATAGHRRGRRRGGGSRGVRAGHQSLRHVAVLRQHTI